MTGFDEDDNYHTSDDETILFDEYEYDENQGRYEDAADCQRFEHENDLGDTY